MTVETKELRPGDSVEYQIDGKTLVLEPVPYGRLKKLIGVVMAAIKDLGGIKEMSNLDLAGMLPDLMEKHVPVLFPLLFSPSKHPFLDKDWIEEYVTIPFATDVIKKAIKINGLDDFFGKMVKRNPEPMAPVVERDLSETIPTIQSENGGSTTSSLSPTNGPSNTSTL